MHMMRDKYSNDLDISKHCEYLVHLDETLVVGPLRGVI